MFCNYEISFCFVRKVEINKIYTFIIPVFFCGISNVHIKIVVNSKYLLVHCIGHRLQNTSKFPKINKTLNNHNNEEKHYAPI